MKKIIIGLILSFTLVLGGVIATHTESAKMALQIKANLEALTDTEIKVGYLCAWDPCFICFPFAFVGDWTPLPQYYMVGSGEY